MPSVAASNEPLVSTLPVASSSITSAGGTRPPSPITVGPGSVLPVETTVTAGEVISVCVRFVLEEPPGRNSVTSPLTSIESPTSTTGAEEVKTKRPSEVAGSASPSGSSMKKPFETVAVTMPATRDTGSPSSGERCAAPWISWISSGGATVRKDQLKSAVIVSGGSVVSRSLPCAAAIVVVHDSSIAKSTSGSSVNVRGPPLAMAVCAPLVVQTISNHEPVTATSSL